jgi:hypothetical protein
LRGKGDLIVVAIASFTRMGTLKDLIGNKRAQKAGRLISTPLD